MSEQKTEEIINANPSKRIVYTYKIMEAWEKHDQNVRNLISTDAIDKIKKLDVDIFVQEIQD
ncbi:hypothetical protein APSETT444_001898 [Aspergillus pseudonomiae]